MGNPLLFVKRTFPSKTSENCLQCHLFLEQMQKKMAKKPGFGGGWSQKSKLTGIGLLKDIFRKMLAEWLGMTVFVAFGVGGTAQWVLLASNQLKYGNWIIVAIGWGFGLAIG